MTISSGWTWGLAGLYDREVLAKEEIMIRLSIALGLILLGALLIYTGYGQTRSVMGGLSKTFSGSYSRETMAYLAGGGLLCIAGLTLLLGKKKG